MYTYSKVSFIASIFEKDKKKVESEEHPLIEKGLKHAILIKNNSIIVNFNKDGNEADE